jgi:hypothetical protein
MAKTEKTGTAPETKPRTIAAGNLMDTERPLAEAKALLNSLYCIGCTSYDEYGDPEDQMNAIRKLVVMVKERVTVTETLIFGKPETEPAGR